MGNGAYGAADTPSTNMFEGTWIALTSETYIGQGLGWVNCGCSSEFAFESALATNQNYVVHQQRNI